jgi:acyl-coenzyme A synthetase/AMP-(fatty) acid ligase
MGTFGDCLYNLYGSTEVGWVSVATPADLRADATTAGKPVRGISVRLLDDADHDVPLGEVGRIAVDTGLEMEAYTDGSARPRAAGLVLTGDLGRFDEAGRLQVVGRADDMVVSGGENVYPSGVEELLAAYPGIADVAVVGVADETYGQRLRAVVVADPGVEIDTEAVREHVRRHRSRHEVPREVVVVDALPRNAAGKILRRDLTD